jgi:hypothetical protein
MLVYELFTECAQRKTQNDYTVNLQLSFTDAPPVSLCHVNEARKILRYAPISKKFAIFLKKLISTVASVEHVSREQP